MLKELESLYEGDIVINGQPEHPEDYEWFYTADGDEIGIAKHRLTEQERRLLALFFTPPSADANRKAKRSGHGNDGWQPATQPRSLGSLLRIAGSFILQPAGRSPTKRSLLTPFAAYFPPRLPSSGNKIGAG
nr:hypothetical protein [Geobacillus sp. JS12]